MSSGAPVLFTCISNHKHYTASPNFFCLGLCRTSEIFGVSEFVIGNLSYINDRTFQSLSVTAEKWIPITEVE